MVLKHILLMGFMKSIRMEDKQLELQILFQIFFNNQVIMKCFATPIHMVSY